MTNITTNTVGNKTIAQFPSADTIQVSDWVPISQGPYTRKTTIASLLSLIEFNSGTVSNVGINTFDGIISSITNSTTTPVIDLSLGAITPDSINTSGNITAGSLTVLGTITASGISAPLTPTGVTPGSYTLTNLTVGSDGRITAASSGTPGSTSPTTTKGDLIVRGASADTRLPVGADTQILVADAAQPTGVKWATAPSSSPTTTKGDLIVRGTSADTRLPVGADTQILVADSTQPAGVKWGAAPASGGTSFNFAATPPGSPVQGDRWMDSNTGICYTFVNDTNTTQWVEL